MSDEKKLESKVAPVASPAQAPVEDPPKVLVINRQYSGVLLRGLRQAPELYLHGELLTMLSILGEQLRPLLGAVKSDEDIVEADIRVSIRRPPTTKTEAKGTGA